MKFKKSIIGTMVSMAVSTGILSASAIANQVVISPSTNNHQITVSDPSLLKAAPGTKATKKRTGAYIVQLKGAPGVAKAEELGELLPSNQLVAQGVNNYNPTSTRMAAYTEKLQSQQNELANNFGSIEILHSYVHTFNGFAAKLTTKQADALRNHPDVASVWEDQVFSPQTSNTPQFLGLLGPDGTGGLHGEGVDGEGVIVGVLDTGIIPEHPSYADDGTYSDPADLGWTGACDAGEEADAGTFVCNNKLVGARYFNESFKSVYDIQYNLGEFESPRDADSHGTHTSSTAAGNAGVTASREGIELGVMSGIAPRARVAMYKVCWNSSYVSEEGANERGCMFGDSMAAIDQAVEDGVDVLNYSIGNSSDLNTPVYNASLRAAQAGVFFAGSAGNDGPGPSTVSNIAPWITSVAASTYTGTVPLVGIATDFTVNEETVEPAFSIEGSITAPPPEEGVTGAVVAIQPALACDADGPIINAEEIAGNIALIARGTCNFSEKILAAQGAGAIAALVYSDSRLPTAMGGEGTGITIPGRMITNEYGLNLAEQLTNGASITATWTDESSIVSSDIIGNTMADFSSRGPNTSTQDIIKPDITAPGVQILAGSSPTQLDISGNEQGENFAYLQGTSMSGPHIAGIAALIKGEHPDWTPAQIQSAMMTSARQNLTKEDGTTPADPFDFGSGHVDPLNALTPGLAYDANINDYLGFLCGQGEETLVASYGDQNCEALSEAGFATDASQLNYPSIAISKLTSTETISRTVTDMTGTGGTYVVTVEAPQGINVEVATYDAEGVETESDDLVVPAGGKASYALTFSKVEGFTPGQFSFGSITLTGTDGTEVRSPIAINPVPDVNIDVPEALSLELNRNRASFPVQMLYTGKTSLDYTGLAAPFFLSGSVVDSGSAPFDFNTAIGLGQYALIAVPEGTKVARFNLFDSFVSAEDTDLDLHIWSCTTGVGCLPVAKSESSSSNEEVILVNPEPKDGTGINVYAVVVWGNSLNGEDSVTYYAPTWIADGAESSTTVRGSSRAINGRFNSIRVTTKGLDPNIYMGGVTFYNADGEAEGTTVLQVTQPQP